ncbi:right-handed parallel beta-helix repeat-containing protein [Streptosporangium sp. NBC_01810]|uniref:right-handed parallel beta-helix repeat-containing protein n=1 Tax=Streptosporangium sp. NBC_01810 TaxID=2975951 RepID=UPI002DDB71A4|nr:right-handed parallel beta-helix repeat-containing protein [Streptosporangium sp. NBC_01810]WSA28256.1 right-handed parallel beta-helix repeat-containing protein [Streptosporangium sp. NBC_01810]
MKIDIKLVVGLVGPLVMATGLWPVAGGNEGMGLGNGADTGGYGNNGGDKEARDLKGLRMVSVSAPAPVMTVPTGPGMVRCPQPTKTVGSADELQQALRSARAGDVIRLRPGTYRGEFVAQRSGTRGKPIFLCGTAQSVLEGGGIKKGYAFHLDRASFWRLVGFTVQNAQKGVMADRTNGSIIQGLTVHDIGDEAVHLRNFSTGNMVQYNKIYNTGLRRAKFGEGVYLGSAESNWKKYSGGQMDKSDNNLVRGNVIRATAEAVDIKEGTSGGHIVGNVFDGSALGGDKLNDSWVDVKGNNYVIEGNTGKKTPQDGFQTHEIVDGWGTGNVFRKNTIDLAGGRGVGINDTVGGNTIACDNKVIGGQLTKKGSCS